MTQSRSILQKIAGLGIAALCFGYFASYVPYSMITKMVTKGLFTSMNGVGYTGFQIQPIMAFATFLSMYLFITCAGWWKYATRFKIFGISLPRPRWFTFLSGICTSGIIITTTLSYTFSGISIVFVMLLMRGGVLAMAPVIDLLSKKRRRKIYWPSWVASGLSFAALFVTFSGKSGTAMTVVCAIDISLYLVSYFLRLSIMSKWAKSNDIEEKRRFFTEEQMVANPVFFFSLLIVGLIGSTMPEQSLPNVIWTGFTNLPFEGHFFKMFLAGVFSYGTGLFGSLIFLDKREHTFCAPANRCSSVIAGVIATYLLAIFYGQKFPPSDELIGTAIILIAILFLMYRTIIDKRKKGICISCLVEKKEEVEVEAGHKGLACEGQQA